jgi:hypothetical protein
MRSGSTHLGIRAELDGQEGAVCSHCWSAFLEQNGRGKDSWSPDKPLVYIMADMEERRLTDSSSAGQVLMATTKAALKEPPLLIER